MFHMNQGKCITFEVVWLNMVKYVYIKSYVKVRLVSVFNLKKIQASFQRMMLGIHTQIPNTWKLSVGYFSVWLHRFSLWCADFLVAYWFLCCRAQTLEHMGCVLPHLKLWLSGLASPWHVGSYSLGLGLNLHPLHWDRFFNHWTVRKSLVGLLIHSRGWLIWIGKNILPHN